MSRPDEALLQVWDRYADLIRTWAGLSDEESDRRAEEVEDTILAAMETPASSPAGIAAKLKVAMLEAGKDSEFQQHLLFGAPEPGRMDVTRQDNLIWSAIRDLERMAIAADARRLEC